MRFWGNLPAITYFSSYTRNLFIVKKLFCNVLILSGFLIALGWLPVSCGQKVTPGSPLPVTVASPATLTTATGFAPGTTFLPENLIARDAASDLTARYTDPTTRYAHGILGDKIEAGGLLVVKAGKRHYYQLDEQYVFEDLQPRMADVDGDGQPEFIAIRSSLTQGAGVAIFKIVKDQLVLLAASDFVGMPNRWLNIAAIADLDNDGILEIAWVQTPHIGGISRVAHLVKDRLAVIDQKSGYSNHRIGQRNLCLSALTTSTPLKTLYLPTNDYAAVVGLQLVGGKISEVNKQDKAVDAAKPLAGQLKLDLLLTDASCVYVP